MRYETPAKISQRSLEKIVQECAKMIQRCFRGYQQRKRFTKVRARLQRFQEILWSMVEGWRVRRIMRTAKVVQVKQEIKQIFSQLRELNYFNRTALTHPEIKQLQQELRHKKYFLSKSIILFEQQGDWTQQQGLLQGHSRSASKMSLVSQRNSRENLLSGASGSKRESQGTHPFNRNSLQSLQTQKGVVPAHSRNLSKETIKIVNQSAE